MSYYLQDVIRHVVSKAILITGVARSGTTMMGTLIHSLCDVEYAFEPPFLFSLIPSIHEMPRDLWCLLYETYLFEDQHMEAVAGRRINFNEHDDSYVFRAKGKREIEARLGRSQRRKELIPMAVRRRIAYKMASMLPFVSTLRQYYPSMQIVVMFRSPESVVTSLLRKAWFSDESLSAYAAMWPSKVQSKPSIPFWVTKEDTELWIKMSELQRCYYYYAVMYEHVLAHDGLLIVNYDVFVKRPREQFACLVTQLGCEFGKKTDELLRDVREPAGTSCNTLTKVNVELRQRVWNVAEKFLAGGG